MRVRSIKNDRESNMRSKDSIRKSLLAAKCIKEAHQKKSLMASARAIIANNRYGKEISETAKYFLRNVTKKDFANKDALLSALASFEKSENKNSIASGLYLGGLMYEGGFLDGRIKNKAIQASVIAKLVPAIYKITRAFMK